MKKQNEKAIKRPNLFKRWYALSEPNKIVWFWQITLLLIFAVIESLMTIFAAKTINCLYTANYSGAFFWLGMELADIWLRNTALHMQYRVYGKHYGIIRSNITKKLYDKILTSDDSSIKRLTNEKIINIAQNNMGYAAEFPEYIAAILRYSIQVIIAIVTIFTANIYGGLIVLALGVVNFFVYNALNKRLGRIMNNRYEKKDLSFQTYSKILTGKTVIEEMHAEEGFKQKLLQDSEEFNKEYEKYYATQSLRDDVYYAIWNLIIYAIAAFFIFLVSKNAMQLTLYLIVVPYLSSSISKLNTLYTKFGGFENTRVDIDRLEIILSLTDKQLIQYGKVNAKTTGYNLGFIDVNYKGEYAELKNLDISFKMHGTNIIKGVRNCGKRYIFDMLRRKIKPDSGEILLDNLGLYNYNPKTYKNHIDYCSAHPVFIKGSVKENLMIATKNFNTVTSLVEELGLSEKINSLPNGYDTEIEEIKDGEIRFWIGLIRAALSKCKILMIYEYPDDVTPSFHVTLQKIIATSEPEKRTLIVFTHKNEYDNLADMLYLVNNGKVTLKKVPKSVLEEQNN